MSPKVRSALVAIGLFLLAAVLLVVFVLRLSSSPDAKVQLGDAVFEVGQVRKLAPLVDRDGPFLFQALNGQRDIYVQHLGNDAATGWLAFEAHAPGQPRTCQLVWRQAEGRFHDPCTQAVFPVDGKGLTQYPTEVRRQKKGGLTLFVDLRTARSGG